MVNAGGVGEVTSPDVGMFLLVVALLAVCCCGCCVLFLYKRRKSKKEDTCCQVDDCVCVGFVEGSDHGVECATCGHAYKDHASLIRSSASSIRRGSQSDNACNATDSDAEGEEGVLPENIDGSASLLRRNVDSDLSVASSFLKRNRVVAQDSFASTVDGHSEEDSADGSAPVLGRKAPARNWSEVHRKALRLDRADTQNSAFDSATSIGERVGRSPLSIAHDSALSVARDSASAENEFESTGGDNFEATEEGTSASD